MNGIQTDEQNQTTFTQKEHMEISYYSTQNMKNQEYTIINSKDYPQDNFQNLKVKMLDDDQQKQKIGDQDMSLLEISQSIQNIMEHSKSIDGSRFILNAKLDNRKLSTDLQDSIFESMHKSKIDSLKKDMICEKTKQNDSFRYSQQDTLQENSMNFQKQRTNRLKSDPSIFIYPQKKEIVRRNNIIKRNFGQVDSVWKRKWMQIFYVISKFRKIARENAMFFRPHMLRRIQVQLIGDQGSSQQYQSSLNYAGRFQLGRQFSFQNFSKYMSFRNYRKMIKLIIKYLGWLIITIQKIIEVYLMTIQVIFQHIPLFHYLSGPYIIWETIIFICSTLLFIYIPFEYSFEIERNSFFKIYFSWICPLVYGIDIFVRANTKSTETGDHVENHLKIFNKYLKTEMATDVLSVLCLNYKLFGFHVTYFFFFVRITKSFRILDILKEQFLLRMKISDLLAQVLYFAHLVCCIWNAVGMHEKLNNQGWIIKYQTQDVSIQIRYLRSFYYSVITMTTIGYGDYTPQSDLEKLTVILIAFISCGVFGYSINSIGSILSDFKKKRNLYLQGLAKINKYFKQYDVDLEIQARARKYLDYIYTDKREDLICSIEQLSNLTEYLQDEIKANVYTKRLKKLRLIRDLFSDDTLTKLALKMSEKIYSHDQDIIDITERTEPILCIVHSGQVAQYVVNENNKKVKEIKTFYEGQHFGLETFLQGSYEPDFNYKSHGISSILKIKLNDFLEVVTKNPEEYEKYCFVKDEVKFNRNLRAAGLSCDSCLQKFHSLKSCPFIFYEGKKEIILRRCLQDGNEKKIDKFERGKQRQRYRALENQLIIIKDANKYKIDNDQNSNSDASSNQDQEDRQSEDEEKNSTFQKSRSLKSNTRDNSTQRKLSIFNQQENNQQANIQQKEKQSSFSVYNPQNQMAPKKISISEDQVMQQDNQNLNQKPSKAFLKKKISFSDQMDQDQTIESKKKMEQNNERPSLRINNQFNSNKDHYSNQSIDPNIQGDYLNVQRNSVIPMDKRTSQALDNSLQIHYMLEQFLKEKNQNRMSITDKNNLFNQRKLSQLQQKYANSYEFNNFEKSQYHIIGYEQASQLFMFDFDGLKVFEYYYPQQNYEQIITNENQLMKSSHQINQFRKLLQKQLVCNRRKLDFKHLQENGIFNKQE